MRKKEREITDRHEIEEVLARAQVLRLGITEPGAPPYIVPVNFGYRDGSIWFHSSYKGKKMELIAKEPSVSFEAEADVAILAPPDQSVACDWGAAFRSVVGQGRAVLLDSEAEKIEGLRIIMSHYAPGLDPSAFTFSEKILKITAVVRIEILRMTGKRNKV